MKGIILNDLYNIGHNMKQMLLLPVIWGVLFLRDSGDSAGSYIVMCAFMFSMMTATAMSYDEKCNWTKYAMILPVSKKSYILAKYVDTFIFSAGGCIIAAIFTAVSNQFLGRRMGGMFWAYCMVGVSIGVVYGSLCIPFLVKYGAEKARFIMLAVMIIPVVIGYGIYRLAEEGNLHIQPATLKLCVRLLPVGALLLVLVTIIFSIRIFEKREF